MAMKGLPRRALHSWIIRAASSLPDPLSPVSNTLASVGPTRSIRRNTSCMATELPSKDSIADKAGGAERSGRPKLTLFITNLLVNALV